MANENKDDLFMHIFHGTSYDKRMFRLKLFLEMQDYSKVIRFDEKLLKISENIWKNK